MCCHDAERLDLPAAVIEMIARYRAMLAERPTDWGDDRVDMFRWARFTSLGDVFTAVAETGDWPAAVRSVVGSEPPTGVVLVRLDGVDGVDGDRSDRPDLSVTAGPARLAVPGTTVQVDVVLDSAWTTDQTVTVNGHAVELPAGGAAVQTLDVGVGDRADAVHVVTGTRSRTVAAPVRVVPAGRLRLHAPWCARWSAVDEGGGAWFPPGVLRKWDVHHHPFFHADDVELQVPAGRLRITCTRGLEYERVERTVDVLAGEAVEVDCAPDRLIDPAAAGWFGGDLHVHMNYSGDQVCTPAQAARMQAGEGLHLMNLVAGNLQTSLVYDRELLAEFAGRELPWSGLDAVAGVGVEYRNDLLGHVHALGPRGVPARFYTGFERSDTTEDWPPNSAACEDFRSLDATVGYPHPAFSGFGDDWSVEAFLATPRSVEARELVVDAALGLVDSVDLISPFDDEGAVFLYHRLLSCGLRLAATAGTDTFLSFSHGPGVASNPPGWGRVYARLDGAALSVEAFKNAVRAGRTTVTNGPWLTLEVAGAGPGSVLGRTRGDELRVIARVSGPGADRLTLVGPDGDLAGVPVDLAAGGELVTTMHVDEPTWLAAVARGPGTAGTLDTAALAHTGAVQVEVDGDRVARSADARWCLELIGRVQGLVAEHGHFQPSTRGARLAGYRELFDRARSYYDGVLSTAVRREETRAADWAG